MPRNNKENSFTFEIIQCLGILSEEGSWKKELNIVKWGDNEPKFDIRPWNEDHSKSGKGITLSAGEIQNLKNLLEQYS